MKDKRWQAFPEGKGRKSFKSFWSNLRKKRILDIKLKVFLLALFNFILIGLYLHTHRDPNILDKATYGVIHLELPILFEILVLIIFFIITLIGLILWIYFFLKETIYPAERQKKRYLLHSWYETKWDIDLVILVVVLIRLLIQPFSVFGSSMEPNFHNHQYIIVDTITYRFRQPERGDIVIFKYPKEKNKNYIKRIIGLPGERIVIENGYIRIFNQHFPEGVILEENYLPPNTKTLPRNKEFSSVDLKENEYFVLGDNRTYSSDSRDFGPLPRDLIIGKTWLICWPVSDWRRIPQVNYNLSP